MRINQITMNGFGKFDQKQITFAKGLNVVHGPNEAGKSTLLAWLIAMLYGMDKKQQQRYRPWKQKEFGAANLLKCTLDNNQTYIIEKNFNRHTTSIYTTEPYREVTALFPVRKKNVLFMEELTGLNLQAFENTVLIKQMEVKVEQKHTKDITERLLRLSQYGDENIDYNNAVKNLDKVQDEIGLGNAGKHKKLIQVSNRIAELEAEKRRAYQCIENIRSLQQEIHKLQTRGQQIQKEIKELTFIKEYKKLPVKQRYRELVQRLEQFHQQKAAIEQQLKMYERFSNLTQQEIETIEQEFHKIKIFEKQAAELKIKIDKQMNEQQNAQRQEAGMSQVAKQHDMRYRLIQDSINQCKQSMLTGKILGACIMGISGLAAVFLGSSSPWWYWLFAIILAAAVVLYQHHKVNVLRMQRLQYQQQRLRTELERNEEAGVHHTIIQAMQEEYQQYISALEKSYGMICSKAEAAGISCGDKSMLPAVVHELKQAYVTRIELERQLEQTIKQIAIADENISITSQTIADNAEDLKREKLNTADCQTVAKQYGITEETTLSQIDKIIEARNRELRQIELTLSSDIREVEILSSQYSHPGDIEERLEKAYAERQQYEDTREAIDIAKYYLEQSLLDIQKNYLPRLNKTVSNTLSIITDNKYHQVDTGSNLEMVLRDIENGTLRPDMLSNGTVDQIYFALRVAVAQLLSDKEMLPFMIDEPFAHYDDTRLANTLDFILRLSIQRQVILLTCQNREIEILDKLGKDYHCITL